MSNISCCGSNCDLCYCFGKMCDGCDESLGNVFHTGGKACPIYDCSVNKNKFKSCVSCGKIPCDIWRNTRDPKFTDDEFEKNIMDRINTLRGGKDK